jgi:hypothetical protein
VRFGKPPKNNMPITDKSSPPKTLSKTDKKNFWRAKKKIAYKNLKTAKKTGNGGWVKMLNKRITKYNRYINESFDAAVNEVLRRHL